MKSSYEKLGKYIRVVDERNTADKRENLLGVSTQKVFIESIANTVGTDFRTYRLIKRGQFAYVPDTSRRGDKIGIALLDHVDEGMISQAYTVFEVVDENRLLSEYLMMWFRRPEFDRYARYMSYGSVREIFSWEDMCGVELPIPHIDKQREIVKEYNTILQRMDLNNQLIQKLEETAQAIYKQWFVDFEFPNENGEPYKSAGGEMVESELGDIPMGWRIDSLGQHIESASKQHDFKKKELIFFNTSDILNGEFLHHDYSPVIDMPGQAKKRIQKDDILYSEIRPANKRFALVRINANDYVVSTKLMVLRRTKFELSVLRFYHLLTENSFVENLQKEAEGRAGTFPQITFEDNLINKSVVIGNDEIETKWEKFLHAYYSRLYQCKDENRNLQEIKSLFLSRLATLEE
jgi:type I restriction enzyme S subunit